MPEKIKPYEATYALVNPLVVFIDGPAEHAFGAPWKLRRYTVTEIRLVIMTEGTYVTGYCASTYRPDMPMHLAQVSFLDKKAGLLDQERAVLNYAKEHLEWDW